MMNLKLTTEPDTAGHTGAKLLAGTYDVPPKPTIKAISTSPPDAPAGSPLFARLPANACDTPGCKKFGHAFPSPQALLEHRRAVHRPRPTESKPETLLAAAQAEPAKKYQCKQCSASFTSPIEIAQHARYMHPKPKSAPTPPPLNGVACPLCSKIVARSSLASHFGALHRGQTLKLASDRYECAVCGFTSATLNTANSHADRFHKTRAGNIIDRQPEPVAGYYPCPHCHVHFPSKKSLGGHIGACRHRHTSPTLPASAAPAPAPAQPSTRNSQPSHAITFTGTKLQCSEIAMLLIEHGYNNLTTGKLGSGLL